MRWFPFFLIVASALPGLSAGQALTADEKVMIDSARSKYYNLDAHGFVSLNCSVNFDFATVPSLPSLDPGADRSLLEATAFQLSLDRNGPKVTHTYPVGTSESAKKNASQLAGVLTSLVQGLFLSWPTKGLDGPIPALDSQIKSVVATSSGYEIILSFPGDPVRIDMDKDLLVTEISSIAGKIDEHPVYTATGEGLIFTGNRATDGTQPGSPTRVEYELDSAVLDGLRLPTSVHLKVNENIDVRYSLRDCSVVKGKVIVVGASPSGPTN